MEGHPVFVYGGSASLQTQAGVVLCLSAGVPVATIAQLMGIRQQTVREIRGRVDSTQCMYVEATEGSISYGNGQVWADVEADEGIFRKAVVGGEGCEKKHVGSSGSAL